ncbi:hypothetical protein KUV56_12730 [Ferrimonas balearica]|uniref:hypothetical protein n=1 Tax=Ferrimonas balearica TaxID=44012 RepID=UPI001C5609C6|nr:hypothetical protein [Ferrimonas balearica]MBW3140364.1 hypothetical protein [Ferrimonas balearica]MBY6107821.1 hypothetical protein [Ferrimonas balearica]
MKSPSNRAFYTFSDPLHDDHSRQVSKLKEKIESLCPFMPTIIDPVPISVHRSSVNICASGMAALHRAD